MVIRDAKKHTKATGASKRGRIPCVVRYLKDSREFPAASPAYVWLLERFIANDPRFLDRCREPRLMRYFAREPGDLFLLSSKDPSESPSAVHRFPNGWYAKVGGVSLSQRFMNLESYAVLIGLRYPKDWDFDDFGRDRILRDRRESAKQSPLDPKDLVYEDADDAFAALEMLRERQRALRAKR